MQNLFIKVLSIAFILLICSRCSGKRVYMMVITPRLDGQLKPHLHIRQLNKRLTSLTFLEQLSCFLMAISSYLCIILSSTSSSIVTPYNQNITRVFEKGVVSICNSTIRSAENVELEIIVTKFFMIKERRKDVKYFGIYPYQQCQACRP